MTMIFCRVSQAKGDSLTMVKTQIDSKMQLHARAVRFAQYLHRKKGILRSLDLVIWLGTSNPKVNEPGIVSFGDLLNPTQMWFCKRRPNKKMGDIMLCVCMHDTLVCCERCDVDDNADIR